MKVLYILVATLLFSASMGIAAQGEHIKEAKLTLRCVSGNEYSCVVAADGSFSIKGVDEDCDGATLSISKTGYNLKSNKLSIQSSQAANKVVTAREAGSGLATGKRTYQPFSKQSIVISGDVDGDGVGDTLTIDMSSSNNTVQGSIKGKFSATYDLKMNKK